MEDRSMGYPGTGVLRCKPLESWSSIRAIYDLNYSVISEPSGLTFGLPAPASLVTAATACVYHLCKALLGVSRTGFQSFPLSFQETACLTIGSYSEGMRECFSLLSLLQIGAKVLCGVTQDGMLFLKFCVFIHCMNRTWHTCLSIEPLMDACIVSTLESL